MTGTTTSPREELLARALWRTVVHDDPVNTMDYVTWVFRTYFGMPMATARARMLLVHTRGRATVSEGPRELMEVHVSDMHGYGLRATIEPVADDGFEGDGAPGAGADR